MKLTEINDSTFKKMVFVAQNNITDNLTFKIYKEFLYNVYGDIVLGVMRLNNTEAIYKDNYVVFIGTRTHHVVSYGELVNLLQIFEVTKKLTIDGSSTKALLWETTLSFKKKYFTTIQHLIDEEHDTIGKNFIENVSSFCPISKNKIRGVFIYNSYLNDLNDEKFVPIIVYEYMDTENKLRKITTLIGLYDMSFVEIECFFSMNNLYNILKINEIKKIILPQTNKNTSPVLRGLDIYVFSRDKYPRYNTPLSEKLETYFNVHEDGISVSINFIDVNTISLSYSNVLMHIGTKDEVINALNLYDTIIDFPCYLRIYHK